MTSSTMDTTRRFAALLAAALGVALWAGSRIEQKRPGTTIARKARASSSFPRRPGIAVPTIPRATTAGIRRSRAPPPRTPATSLSSGPVTLSITV